MYKSILECNLLVDCCYLIMQLLAQTTKKQKQIQANSKLKLWFF